MSCLKIISKRKRLEKIIEIFPKGTDINYHRRGDIRSKSKDDKWEYDLISIWFARKEWEDLPEQVKAATKFINKNKHQIKTINELFGPDEISFDFPIYSQLDEYAVQQEAFPRKFIQLCAHNHISLNLAIYR